MKVKKTYAGAKLREARQGLNLSQLMFAKALGVSVSYYCQMENNHRFITYDVLSPSYFPIK